MNSDTNEKLRCVCDCGKTWFIPFTVDVDPNYVMCKECKDLVFGERKDKPLEEEKEVDA